MSRASGGGDLVISPVPCSRQSHTSPSVSPLPRSRSGRPPMIVLLILALISVTPTSISMRCWNESPVRIRQPRSPRCCSISGSQPASAMFIRTRCSGPVRSAHSACSPTSTSRCGVGSTKPPPSNSRPTSAAGNARPTPRALRCITGPARAATAVSVGFASIEHGDYRTTHLVVRKLSDLSRYQAGPSPIHSFR